MGERPSGRKGGVREREACRYASSAGERSVVCVEAMMIAGKDWGGCGPR